jgi:hypothetical protein
MDDARRMVELVQQRGLAGVLGSTGDKSPVYKAAPDTRDAVLRQSG